jgi:hypothetical protein
VHRPLILLGVIDLSGERLVPINITGSDHFEGPSGPVDREHQLSLLVVMHVREHPPGLRERIADDGAEGGTVEAGEADEPARGADEPEVPGGEEAEGELVAGAEGEAEHAAALRRGVGGAPALGEGEEAGRRGEEGRVVESGGPAAGDGAEAEEEEGRDAGQHLQEKVVGEPRPDTGVHLDVRVLQERGRGTSAGGARGGEDLGECQRRRGVLVYAPRLTAADRLEAATAPLSLSLPGVGSSFWTEAGIHSEEREAQLVNQMGSGMEDWPERNDTHASHSVIALQRHKQSTKCAAKLGE